MIIRICAFTKTGWEQVATIENKFTEHIFERRPSDITLQDWVGEAFSMKAPLIFIGAVGIAVRSIASFVTDKLTDSPVIVIDENAKYVIPILSSHVGGAAPLARELALRLGAEAVITTSTDVHSLFSVDSFAVENGLEIINRDGIRKVSTKLLDEGSVKISVAPGIQILNDEPPKELRLVDYILDSNEGKEEEPLADIIISYEESDVSRAGILLRPREYILGIGCKKGTSEESVRNAVEHVLRSSNLSMREIATIASIDMKSKEYGLVLYAQKEKKPLITYSADLLALVEGEFSESSFVQSVTGVSNVCERAAVCYAGQGAEVIIPKHAVDGVTVAVVRRNVLLRF